MLNVAHFGSTGNLGVHVLGELLRRDHDVTCFVRSEPRFTEMLSLEEFSANAKASIVVVQGDARDPKAVNEFLSSKRFDVLVSTAGCVNNDVITREGAADSDFCRIFSVIADAAERYLPPPRRAIFVGGMPALSLPGATQTLQSLLASRSPQYVAHTHNNARLLRSSLDWTLLCPGYMTDAPAWDEPLRLSEDIIPSFEMRGRFRNWQLSSPLQLPPVALLRVARHQGQLTVPYAAAAASLVDHLEPGGRFSRRRMGLANPAGRTLRKTKETRARELQQRDASSHRSGCCRARVNRPRRTRT